MNKKVVLVFVVLGLFSDCKKEESEIDDIRNEPFLVIGDQKATIESYNELIYDASDVNGENDAEFDIDSDRRVEFGFHSIGSSSHCWRGVTLSFYSYDSCKVLVTDTISYMRKPIMMSLGDTIKYSSSWKKSGFQILSKGILLCDMGKSQEIQSDTSSVFINLNDYLGILIEKEKYNILCWVKLTSSIYSDPIDLKVVETGYVKIAL